jgi:hypothetical protein
MSAYLAFGALCFLGFPLLVSIILYLLAARGLGWPPFRKNGGAESLQDQA